MKNVSKYVLTLFLALVSSVAFAAGLNVNTATAEQIAEAMNGVGTMKAEAIIKDREMRGPFKSLDEMSRVKGIGIATIDKNRENITVE